MKPEPRPSPAAPSGPRRWRRYAAFVHADLAETYARNLHKWVVIAPLMGIFVGLLTTLLVKVILQWMWPSLLGLYLRHPWGMVPGVAAGFLAAGLIMQFLTPNPDEHSTEEIIRSYHERQGAVAMRPFASKLTAAIATVGAGGSAALEGPGIYLGGAIGSWLWTRLRAFELSPRDRRILLISGAAAGMSAVFRAPLTGVIFALEMPYKDDLAHEALLPALLASVTSFVTLAAFMGTRPLFNFMSAGSYSRMDLLWSAVLGAICGLIIMPFTITFRRVREFFIALRLPHWIKMTLGGLATGACGLVFIRLFPGTLTPLGPNYEAVPQILQHAHSTAELVTFAGLKLLATLATLGVGGVSAMFVPLFLVGGSLGTAFAQSVIHASSLNLFAAVGMASCIASGYKTPLTAVVFVAEATGGHAFIIPTLIGAAVAYAVSGEASASGGQRLHERVKIAELEPIEVQQVMRPPALLAEPDWSLGELARQAAHAGGATAFPVMEHGRLLGAIALSRLGGIPAGQWGKVTLREVMDREIPQAPPGTGLQDALHMLMDRREIPLLVVAGEDGQVLGVVTGTEILSALNMAGEKTETAR